MGIAALAVLALLGGVFWHLLGGRAVRSRSFESFRKDVAPVLATTCSSRDEKGAFTCHGRSTEGFAALAAAPGQSPQHGFAAARSGTCAVRCHSQRGGMDFAFALGPSGRLETERQLLLAYEKARPRARFGGPAKFAKLLRMPLAAQAGGLGLFHGGGEIFDSATDPEYRALARWVDLENREAGGGSVQPGAAERAFRDEVLPVLARNSCMAPSCHSFNHSSFLPDPGMPDADLTRPIAERFTPEQVSYNRMTAKGLIQSLVYLTGNAARSRILAKNIPLEKGGVLHRGGNEQFFSGPEDPDYQALERWIGLERREAAAKLRIGGRPVPEGLVGKLRGVVFVRAPRNNHRRYLDVGRYLPGGDLYLLKLKEGETLETATSPPVNLTARFHPGRPADVRKPDVRYDGRAVLFAMRVGEADNLNIYELSLDEGLDYVEGSFRKLTHRPADAHGGRAHYTDPVYVPDPLDENAAAGGLNLDRADIVFASSLAGERTRAVPRGILGEAAGGDSRAIVDFDRPEPDGSFVGRRIHIVDGTNRGSWRTITAFRNELFTAKKRSVITVDRPFPAPVDESTVYVIERDPRTQPGFLPSYSVYGMKYPPPGKEREMFDQTLTRITWGPAELDLGVRSTGEVFFVSQRSGCDKRGRPVFNMASCRRHLDTRFSFPTHQGNRSKILITASNHELPDGTDVHAGLDPDGLWGSGDLTISDHQFGPDLEDRNPNTYAAGMFDAAGTPRSAGTDRTNTRFRFPGRSPSHPRFVFKSTPLFPRSGPGAVTRTGFSPGGAFRDPVPLPDGGILVSHARAPLDHLDPRADPDFDLTVLRGDPSLQPPGGKGVPKLRKTRVAAAGSAVTSEVEARPVVVRVKPKINAANRPRKEHLIRYPGRPRDTRPARYLERNFLVIDAIMRDPTPVGKHVRYDVDPVTGGATDPLDRVAAVRLVEVLPMTPELVRPVAAQDIRNRDPESTLVANGITPMKRVLGEARVFPDGSVSAWVPSNTPLIMQSLNRDGLVVHQDARYYFFAPNETFTISPSPSETFQTCGACMGAMSGRPGRLFGPVNPFPGQGTVLALAEGAASSEVMGARPEDRRSVDFTRDIQPVLDRRCAACHGGRDAAAGLTLTGRKTRYYNDAYESLLQLEEPASRWYGRKKYVSERDALAIESYLIAKLTGRQLKASRPLSGDRPHPSPALFRARGLEPAPLSEAERRLLSLWIDLGAPFRGPR